MVSPDINPTAIMAMDPNDTGYTLIQNATAEPEDEADPGRSLGQFLWVFVGPIIFVVGICGNILILMVMGKKRMRGTTTSVYLRLMAIGDICVLITGMIPEWLEQADIITFKYIHPATCKLEKFTFYTSADTAIWILVIFTLDRFIAVCFPLEKKEYCLPSRAKYFALGALLLAIAKNFHVFWTRGAQHILVSGDPEYGNETTKVKNCGRPTPEFEYFEDYIRPWIAFTMVNAIPFCVILFCNVFIIRALVVVKRLRSEQAIVSNSDRQLVQMSLMCLSASFSFLICITPSIVLLIGRPQWSKDNRAYDIAKAINHPLVYVNHSINFFLYCMTGKRFRNVLVRIFTRGGSGSPNGSLDSNTRTTVYRTNLPTAKINMTKNGNIHLLSKESSSPRHSPRPSPRPSPRLGGERSASRTTEGSPFLLKKNLRRNGEKHESSL